MNSAFGDVLSQHTASERISNPESETFVTLRLNGNGAVRRKVGEGKTPQAFSGYRVNAGQFIYSRIDARNGAFAIVPSELDGAVVSKDFPVFDIDTSLVDPRYLLSFVTTTTFIDGIRRLSFGATNRQRVKEEIFLRLPLVLPPLNEQRRIAAILDKADELRTKRRQALAQLEILTQSIFHSMFGDPIRNDRNWRTVRLDQLGRITTGNTPSRAVDSNFGDFIEWIKTDNINIPRATLSPASEGLSETGAAKGRIVEPGSVLMTCIAGSPNVIGNVAIADRRVAFNQQINAFTPNEGPTYYWYGLLLGIKRSVQAASTGGMTGMVSKSTLAAIDAIETPLELQQTFATRVAAVERLKESHRKHLAELDALFASLQHRAFKGEL